MRLKHKLYLNDGKWFMYVHFGAVDIDDKLKCEMIKQRVLEKEMLRCRWTQSID